jgi:hypothetical protein
MAEQKMTFMAALGFCCLCALALSGCALFPAVIGAGIAKPSQGWSETDLPELAQREDVIDIASRLGESLGYEVSLKTEDTVILLHETSEYIEPLNGKYQTVRIFVYKVKPLSNKDLPQYREKDLQEIVRKIKPTRTKAASVHLSVYGGGASPSGTQPNVSQIMEEFKSQLLRLTSAPQPGISAPN